MSVHENVIIDLLPAYFAGEASPESCALVDAYFAAHPEFARGMRESQQISPDIPAGKTSSAAVIALREVKNLLRWRGVLMGIGIFFSLAPLSFVFHDDRIVWSMLGDAPSAAALYGAAGVVAWICYFVVRKRIDSV